MPSTSLLFTISEYLKYRFRAIGAHGLHSPFLFDLYNKVIKKKDLETELELLEFRKGIINPEQTLTYTDPKSKERKTATAEQLFKQTASHHDFSYFLIRLINYLGYERVLETGTSLGINALYLARSKAKKVVTIEGSEEIATIAQSYFEANNANSIELIIGHVRDVFARVLQEVQPELLFLDADHRSETIAFYLESVKKAAAGVKCIVVHDIYWSSDMKNAWQKIINDPTYNLTVDMFQAGIIFPDHPIEKQHFTIKF